MKGEIIEIGSISSRGQIAIPASIRRELGLEDGSKILFLVKDETVLMRKVTTQTFAEITKPLKDEAKRVGFKESEVEGIMERFRKTKK